MTKLKNDGANQPNRKRAARLPPAKAGGRRPSCSKRGAVAGEDCSEGLRRNDRVAALFALARAAVAAAFEVPPRALMARARSTPRIAQARQAAAYLAHVSFGLGINEVAKHFRRHRTTVTHALEVVEDRRDDSCFDAALSSLEQGINQLKRWTSDLECGR